MTKEAEAFEFKLEELKLRLKVLTDTELKFEFVMQELAYMHARLEIQDDVNRDVLKAYKHLVDADGVR